MNFVAGALGIFSAITGILGAGEQYDIDIGAINLKHDAGQEEIRRRKYTQRQSLGMTTVLTEASGVTHGAGSTTQQNIDVMTSEFKKEIDWMRTFTEETRRLGIEQARRNRIAGFFGGLSSGINTAVGIAGAGK